MMTDSNKTNEPNQVIKETVAEYTVIERATDQSQPIPAEELEPWQRSLDSYTDEELTALYADYADEARQLAEVGIEEYAQRLLELDRA